MAAVPIPAFPTLTGRAILRMTPRMLRRMLPMLVLDGLCPILIYLLLRPRFPQGSVYPLAVAVLFPLIGNGLSMVRRRRLDTFGMLVLLSLAATLGVVLLGGTQRMLLITHNLVGPVWGLACLISLALPKPLAFYMIRQFVTGDASAPGAMFDALWLYPYVRAVSRLASAVWGIAMTGEFAVRVVLVLTLPVVQVLAISSVLMMAVGLGLGAWNILYGARVVRRLRVLTYRAA